MFFHWFFLFALYSFLGWCCETLFCSLAARRYINRGFLSGPFCPIYGFGALFVIWAFSYLSDHPVLLFLLGIIGCSLLEYFTSWLLENLFHMSLWDYSNRRGNLNGRICVRNSLLFGLLSVAMIYGIHPMVTHLLSLLPPWSTLLFFCLFLAYFFFDLILTVRALISLEQEAGLRDMDLQQLTDTRDTYKEKMKRKTRLRFRRSRARLFLAFPRMRSLRHPESLRQLKAECQKGLQNLRRNVEEEWNFVRKNVRDHSRRDPDTPQKECLNRKDR